MSWEQLTDVGSGTLSFRKKVHGGWLIKASYLPDDILVSAAHMIFIPDPRHTWETVLPWEYHEPFSMEERVVAEATLPVPGGEVMRMTSIRVDRETTLMTASMFMFLHLQKVDAEAEVE